MKAIDWLGRGLFLVLSGTATLSLIGAIVETTDGGPGSMPRPVVERIEVRPLPDEGAVVRAPVPPGQAVEPGMMPPDREAIRWLRALTYAVTALAGFAAAGVVVLLRITATLERIARR